MTIYYNLLSEIVEVLKNKYNEIVSIPHVNYETSERVIGQNFYATIYRMPSGKYELVDYKTNGGKNANL